MLASGALASLLTSAGVKTLRSSSKNATSCAAPRVAASRRPAANRISRAHAASSHGRVTEQVGNVEMPGLARRKSGEFERESMIMLVRG